MLQISIDPPEPIEERTPEGFDIRLPAVESWVRDLPLADVSKTCGLVFNALADSNTQPLPPTHRYKLLELLRAPVAYLSDALSRQLINAALPLPPQIARIAALRHGLQLESAKGYQRIANELLTLDGLRQDFNLLAAALQRALSGYGQALLTGYQAYRPAATGLWRTVHGLYEAAERKAVHNIPVKDNADPGRSTTVAAGYTQILLLALADPMRFAQADMARLYGLLGSWAGAVKLAAVEPLRPPVEGCIVDLASDHPPAQVIYSHTASLLQSCRLLDLTALLARLRRSPAGEELPGRPPQGLPPERARQDLIAQLLATCDQRAKRLFTRRGESLAPMQVVVGLGECHRLLSDGNDDGEQPIPFAEYLRRNRVQPPTANEISPHLTQVIDESAKGARLRWRGGARRLRVGEVLATRHDETHQGEWGVAVVRWLRAADNPELELGIEMLAPSAAPVSVRHHHEQESDLKYLKSLYLPEVRALRQPPSLLVPAGLFQEGGVVSLRQDGKKQRLRLTRAVEHNRIYGRFLFSTA